MYGPDILSKSKASSGKEDGNMIGLQWIAISPSLLTSLANLSSVRSLYPINESYQILSWDFVEFQYGKEIPYFWVYCSSFSDLNLILRPPIPKFRPPRANLSEKDLKDVKDYVSHLSVQKTNLDNKPLFDTVLIIYLDAVSRIKFHHFYNRSLKALENLGVNGKQNHIAVELKRFHALGKSSPRNYPQLMAGICPNGPDGDRFFNHSSDSKRAPWLFDLAALHSFETLSGMTSCQNLCESDCYRKLSTFEGYENGGFIQQYMADTDNSHPGVYNFPGSVSCEVVHQSALNEKSCSTCSKDLTQRERWIGNKLGMSYAFDWWRVWLNAYREKNRFATFIFEETHEETHNDFFDRELARFLDDLTSDPSRYATQNAAIIVMADHGMHFADEAKALTGNVANKQPFGYIILPRQYLQNHPSEATNLRYNARGLVSPYDLRATLQYWLSGRDWSASTLKENVYEKRKEYLKDIFGSNYGENLMLKRLQEDRSCESAGIPNSFCGCNLFPCTSESSLIGDHAKHIAYYVNKLIRLDDPKAVGVCRPLKPDEITIIRSPDHCLSDNNKIIVDAVVSRMNKMLSVTFHRLDSENVTVSSVVTVDRYRDIWKQCVKMFNERKIPIKVKEFHQQHCHCVFPHSNSFKLGKFQSISLRKNANTPFNKTSFS